MNLTVIGLNETLNCMNSIAFFSAVFIFFLIWAFFVLYIKSLQKEIDAYGSVISEKIRLRLDMLPRVIEIVQRYSFSDAKLIADIIQMRQKSWPIEELSLHKVHTELNLSAVLRTLWKETAQFQDLQKDIDFLSSRAEIHESGKYIEQFQDIYNQRIRSYNGKVNLFMLKPFLSLLGLRSMNIFEFEA